jgi:NTE family protein
MAKRKGASDLAQPAPDTAGGAALEADADRSENGNLNGEPGDGHGHGHADGGPLRGARGVHRPRWRGYTAFVLSGGGARGALQVGVLRALLECGERPDVIVGTSIGAWNGAVLALDPTPAGVEALEAAWRTAHPTRVLLGSEPPVGTSQALAAMRALTAVRRLAAGEPSLYGDAGMRQFIAQLLGDTTFEQLAVPLRVIATDITHGTRAIFGTGPVAPAVLASSAIPGIFPPVRIGEAVYVDGGALDNASIETALALGARRIFVLDVGYDEHGSHERLWSEVQPEDSHRRRSAGVLAISAVLERTAQVISRYQLDRTLQRVPPGIEVHVLRVGTEAGGGALEFEKASRWMKQGYEAAVAYLARERAASAAEPASPR